MQALQAVRDIGNFGWCRLCGKLTIEANAKLYCKKCDKLNARFATVRQELTRNEQNCIANRIKTANETHLTIKNEIPFRLQRYWSKCVTVTLDLFTSAQSDKDAFEALEAWTKLKSVLIQPLRGGLQKKRLELRYYEKKMLEWISGN